MTPIITNLLSELGLDDKSAAIYLATLELGGKPASVIAKKAGIERVNAYYILDQLVHKGLMYTAKSQRATVFVASSPRKLEALAEARLREIQKALPELLSIENSSSAKPRVRFYEGIEGIKQLFEETLDVPMGTETLAYSSAQDIHGYLKEYVPFYLDRRVKGKISQRAIAEYSPAALEHQRHDTQELRETVLVDSGRFPFKNEINIFGDKVMIASYRDMMGVIIESKEIADTQRSVFELAWLGAKQVAAR